MTRIRAVAMTLFVAVALVALVAVHPFVEYQTMIDHLVIAGAIPATLFVFLYPILSPKIWKTWVGRALWTSSFGLAALLDLTLLAKWFNLILPRVVVALMLVVIVAGAWMKLYMLLSEKARALRTAKAQHDG